MAKEYLFSRIETEKVSVDFDRLFKDIIADNPNIDTSDIYDEFGNNAGYYLQMQLGYDPFDRFYEPADTVMDIWNDFETYLEKHGDTNFVNYEYYES